jgi:hypothetical protein
MSGYKHATVTISQEEYRRLQATDVKKRLKGFTPVNAPENGNDEVVRNLIQQLEERERDLQLSLASQEHSPAQSDLGLLQEIVNQNTAYYENLISVFRSNEIDVQASINSLSNEFFQAMEFDRGLINQNLQSIVQEQSYYQENEYNKSIVAQQWLEGCFTLANFIQRQFDHERFSPSRFSHILRNLELAESNFSNGFFESSLQSSQQMYLELSDLNFELEQIFVQWQILFERTFVAVDEMIYQMVSNGKINAIGLQGEELPDLVDLNYWTKGRFHQLLEHTRQLSSNLVNDQNILTTEDLDRIYNQIIPVIRESFETMVYDARLSALNSQLRMNIAEKALIALENHGFFLDQSGYSDDDMRSQFNAHLACPDGSEVTINVLPNEKSAEELSNELIVVTSHPYLKTDHEAKLHWEELSQTLRHYNLIVGRPEVGTTPTDTYTGSPTHTSTLEQQLYKTEK